MSPFPPATLRLRALAGLPVVAEGDDLVAPIADAIRATGEELRDGDALVVASKLVARAQGRFVDLDATRPGDHARRLAARCGKDPALVEWILRESSAVSRAGPGVLVVRHRLGLVLANAGIDRSNARPLPDRPGRWVLLLPENPDGAAAALARGIREHLGRRVAVVLSDSLGRPFRLGTVGCAIGAAGLPALLDLRGRPDLFGRPLEHSSAALADQLAAAADLLAGQADEARPVTWFQGLGLPAADGRATDLLRPPDRDLYA